MIHTSYVPDQSDIACVSKKDAGSLLTVPLINAHFAQCVAKYEIIRYRSILQLLINLIEDIAIANCVFETQAESVGIRMDISGSD